MNGPGDIPLTYSSTSDTRPCSLISIIPTFGMSSCRGRAEAFARRLSSKLRTLGSQTDDDSISPEDEPIINGGSANNNNNNTWMSAPDSNPQTVTDLQPLPHESDSFFDFDCEELESPGSPVDECEYLRLIETASNTPHNSAAESGYVCASAASSHSSTDASTLYHDDERGVQQISIEPESASEAACSMTVRATLASNVSDLNDFAEALKLNSNVVTELAVLDAVTTSHLTNGHNGKDAAYEIDNDEIDHENSNPMMVEKAKRIQEDIISELQKQSEDYRAEEHERQPSTEKKNLTPATSLLSAATTRASIEDGEQNTATIHTIALQPTMASDSNNIEQPTKEILQSEVSRQLTDVNAPSPAVSPQRETAKIPDESTIAAKDTTNIKLSQRLAGSGGLDTTDDEDECRPQRVRRCSSLKTGKTPPGTPGRKKIVRFADVLGLDLADVKTFLDEVPTIPKSAFEDLEIMETEAPLQLGPKSDKLLMPLFQQPGGLSTFLDIVREKQVSLENAALTDHIHQTISGSVRVRNLDFHKSVHIRYSLDGWRSYADLQANYVKNSCDGFSDKFTFILFGNSLQIGQRLEFAVRFQCKGQQFWDNNYGANYCFQCLPSSTNAVTHPVHPLVATHHTGTAITGMLSPTAGEAWCSSFY